MISKPEILFLDEPFNFLDPSSQIIMKRLLLDYNQKYGTTILLSSHNLEHVMDICSRIILLESGKIIQDYTDINDNERLEIKRYFENKV
jgi:ABC-2 type transport system ATP-binding protein